MNGGGRPSAVRRFLLRPWWWVGLVIAAAPAIVWIDQQSRSDPLPGPDSIRVQATVEGRHGGEVDVAYDHPLTGQRVQTSAPRHGDAQAGDPVDIAVDPADPERVRLAGDSQPESPFDALSAALLLLLPLIWASMRHWSVHAADRLAASSGVPSFAMVGALAAPRRAGRRPTLHLWPLDSTPQDEALCAVPVLVTGGLPVDVAFPVEVKGSPRSFGRVVARAGDTVLWPAARALRSPWLRRPDTVEAEPPWLGSVSEPERVRRPQRQTSFVVAQWPLLLGFAATVAIAGAVAGGTLTHRRDANRLYRDGTQVVAEIAERGGTTVTVTYRLPGDAAVRTGRAAVDWPEEQKIGLRLPAVVDPARPGRLRLLRQPYDAGEPIAWAAIPCVGLGAAVFTQQRRWRRSARIAATTTQWRTVAAQRFTRHGFTYLTVQGSAGPVLQVRLPPESTWRFERWNAAGANTVEMAGELDPGSPVAIRHHDRLLPLTSAALVPKKARPDRPSPPQWASWPRPRPDTGPGTR